MEREGRFGRGQQSPSRTSAHDLCDRTIQALFGVGLQLESCVPQVDDERMKAHLAAAVASLNGVIAELRDFLHEIDRPDAGAAPQRRQ